MFYISLCRNDEKARRAQKKTKDSYLNAFSNKIKQNIDKYRTELTGSENDNDNDDSPASTVNFFSFTLTRRLSCLSVMCLFVCVGGCLCFSVCCQCRGSLSQVWLWACLSVFRYFSPLLGIPVEICFYIHVSFSVGVPVCLIVCFLVWIL